MPVVFAAAVDAFDPIFGGNARLAFVHAVRSINAIVTKNGGGHRFEKTDAPIGPVTTVKPAFAAGACVNGV